MAYSSNTISVAVYPICVEYKTEEDDGVHKGAITFISDDKLHDHQQVKAFEKRMFQILREKHGFQINHWQRWSDGCGAQFRLQYSNADLINAKESFQLKNASSSYFEANKGKNTSDTIGSIVKCAFVKGTAKANQGIGKASDVVELVAANVKSETKKFDFFIIEEFPFIERIEEKDCASFEINGISKAHQLYVRDEGLVADELSCIYCTPHKLCDECEEKDYYQVDAENSGEDDDNADGFIDVDDIGQSDEECDDDDEDNEENSSSYAPGDIVWGKYGKFYYPAKIVSHGEFPEKLQKSFRVRKAESVIVRWYGEGNFSWVQNKNLDELAENKSDSTRAAINEEMHHKYQLALADLRND